MLYLLLKVLLVVVDPQLTDRSVRAANFVDQ